MTFSLPFKRPDMSIGILVVVHFFGVLGMATPWRDWFVAMTPLTLVVSAVVLLVNHREWNPAFVGIAILCCLVGFFIEVAGVATGVIFGEYAYGSTLGIQAWGVPLVMGVNWLVLVYSTGAIAHRLPLPRIAQAAVAAGLMTLLDVVLEPVAIRLDFWTWSEGMPPLQNYLAWFAVAFVLLTAFHYLKFNKQNKVGVALYCIQFVFFLSINLFF
ncbi:MAG: carotenoid biosynthesis protein [Bacteroidota bacterium]